MDEEEAAQWRRMAENAEVMYVSAAEWDQLMEALEKEPTAEEIEKLAALLRRSSVFEKNPEDSPTGP